MLRLITALPLPQPLFLKPTLLDQLLLVALAPNRPFYRLAIEYSSWTRGDFPSGALQRTTLFACHRAYPCFDRCCTSTGSH